MRIQFQSSAGGRAGGAPPPGYPPAAVGVRIPEFDPVAVAVPVQVIVYMPDAPITYYGTGLTYADGKTTVSLPEVPAPPPGTTVQVVMYPDQPAPTIIEGIATQSLDGLIGIVVPDGLRN